MGDSIDLVSNTKSINALDTRIKIGKSILLEPEVSWPVFLINRKILYSTQLYEHYILLLRNLQFTCQQVQYIINKGTWL